MILVTGGSGVLGHALREELAAGDEALHVVGTREVDLRDAAATAAMFDTLRPRLVYHLAAKVHGLGGNSRYPAEMFTDNVRINTNVVDAAARAGCAKIVAVSTVAVYASDVARPTPESAIWSGPPHGSEAAYGHAKRAMLAQLEAYAAQYGLRFAYPLMTNIYGPHDRFDVANGHVVPSLIAKFHAARRSGAPVSIWGTGRAARDFLYAADAARALVAIAEAHDGPINVATGRPVAIREMVGLLQAVSGVGDVVWDDTKPDGQLERSYEVSALAALGFTARVSLEQGLATTWRWYDEHYPDVRC